MNVIGIDIGGTTIKGMLLNDRMEKLHSSVCSTDALAGKEGILSSLTNLLTELISAADRPLRAIGVGSAGRIDTQSGKVVYATDNLPGWNGFHLKAWIEETFKIPAIIDNDANVALLGEVYLGDQQIKNQNTVMLTLGTGVGGANYFFGQIVRGAHHQSGEWGHTVLYPGGYTCNCGKSGCIEQYVSGSALKRKAEMATGRPYPHGKDVFKDINGDRRVREVVSEFVRDLSIVIGNIAVCLDPDRIILGGGVVESSEYWWEELKQTLHRAGVATHVQKARFMNQSGMYGAAVLALQAEEGSEVV